MTHCPKCGRGIERETSSHSEYGEAWGASYKETVQTLEPYTCSCGFFLDENEEPEGVGIRELLEDAGYYIDRSGILFCFEEDCCEETLPMRPRLEDIEQDHAEPSPVIKYFIQGERPENFKPFTLWNGREIK